MSSSVRAAVVAAEATLREAFDDHPVWRRRDLLAVGISDALQSAMIRSHALVRLRHGVYALAALADGQEPGERHRIDLAAAIAAAEEPTWAFGASAVLLHGLPLPFRAPERIHLLRQGHADVRSLTQPSRHRLVIPSATVASSSRITPTDVTVRRGVPTVCRDVAAVTGAVDLPLWWQVALLDAVLWQGESDHDRLSLLAEQWRHLGGLKHLRHAIDLAREGAQTPLETFSRLALRAEGLPEPELQVAFHDAEGLIGYVDMWWSSLRVIGEADGAMKYASTADLMREKAREDRLRALGFIVVRWTWDEIRSQPAAVAERVRRAARRTA